MLIKKIDKLVQEWLSSGLSVPQIEMELYEIARSGLKVFAIAIVRRLYRCNLRDARESYTLKLVMR